MHCDKIALAEIKIRQERNAKILKEAPQNLCAIVFLNSNNSQRHFFAIAELKETQGRHGIYQLLGKPIEVVHNFYKEMYDYYLPHFDMRWPYGVCEFCGEDYDVFMFSIANAYSCLNMLHPKTLFEISEPDLIEASLYEQSGKKLNETILKLQIKYNKLVFQLFDAFKEALHQMDKLSLHREIESMQTQLDSQIDLTAVLGGALEFEQERNRVLAENHESQSYETISSNSLLELHSMFPNLMPSVLKSISRAEADWQIKQNDPHAANDVIFNYARAIEAQICDIAAGQLNGVVPSLGIIAKLCDEGRLKLKLPSRYIGKLYEIADARNDVDHGVERDWSTARRIRAILFDEGLLQRLDLLAAI